MKLICYPILSLGLLLGGIQSPALASPDTATLGIVGQMRTSISTGKINGVYVASACGGPAAPRWCTGSDIGAWINAAIADGNKGNLDTPVRIIIDPTAQYTHATPIIIPLNVALDCQGAQLNSTMTTGAQVVIGSGQNNIFLVGPLSNCTLNGPGYVAGHSDYGVFIGGDPTGVISAPETYGPDKLGYNNHIEGHAYGIGWGNNAWSPRFEGFTIWHNKEGIYTPKNAASATVSGFSITSNVLTLTTSAQSFAIGQPLNITDLTTGVYLDGVALTIASATGTTISAPFAHADVGYTSDSGTAYANGVHNSGELIRVSGSDISNNSDCGFYTQSTSEISLTDNSIDYNINGAFCGSQANLTILDSHLEQKTAPFFNYTNGASVKLLAGTIAITNVTGSESGIIQFASPNSRAYLYNVTYYAKHQIDNWIYTSGGTVLALCVRDPYYEAIVGTVAYSDAISPPSCVQN